MTAGQLSSGLQYSRKDFQHRRWIRWRRRLVLVLDSDFRPQSLGEQRPAILRSRLHEPIDEFGIRFDFGKRWERTFTLTCHDGFYRLIAVT